MISFQIAVYTLLVYSAISFRIIIRLFQTIRTQIARQWLASIIVFFSAELILFTTFLIKRYRFMQVEAILFFLMIYLFVFSELRWKIVQRVHRNMVSEIDGDESLNQRLIQSMENQRLYLSSSLTLSELAKSVGINPQKLSNHLNLRFGQNFNDFVNRYRVEEAKRLLADPVNREKTIAAIAYECGFNSLSVFNPAFKKFIGTTPSQFRNRE